MTQAEAKKYAEERGYAYEEINRLRPKRSGSRRSRLRLP